MIRPDDLIEVVTVATNVKTDEEKAKIVALVKLVKITNPLELLELLVVAAKARTDEAQARVAWRASDHMWRNFPRYDLVTCRVFNNLLQQQKWPWVEDLWSEEERKEIMSRYENLGVAND
jgi:hypothetical protein